MALDQFGRLLDVVPIQLAAHARQERVAVGAGWNLFGEVERAARIQQRRFLPPLAELLQHGAAHRALGQAEDESRPRW